MDMNGITVSVWIAELGIWPLVVVLVPNLMFRRYGQASGKKRMSSLMQAIAVFLITTVAAFVVERELTDMYLFFGIGIVAVALYIFRARVFPYRLSCAECETKLDFKTIYFMDDNLCPACHSKKVAEEDAAEPETEPVSESAEIDDTSTDNPDKDSE
jgi:8-oxo-dGTP diphosphatase